PPGTNGRLCARRRVGARAPPQRGDTTQFAVDWPRSARARAPRAMAALRRRDRLQSILIARLPYLKVVKYLFTVYKPFSDVFKVKFCRNILNLSVSFLH